MSTDYFAFAFSSAVSANPRNFRVLLLLSLVLGTVMGSRFFKSGKFMPAGLIFTLCAVSVIRYGLRLL
ncbi:uncharacterized protein BJ171DRAFT_583164 [Polychytrium aggregatum]|uniref:uncharacterized protein n=1 Tax=Polychytrium aggregatum TaxID=110093 RepID=UPI0022FDE169|nr:uncharacterized protein BJ171DRAFT_583164 [Polychytrium aggregatum]KAI9203328.1 hypothetical protein BJ171DRAFT_583164 [Polychytrium aggregatum]